MERAPPPSPRPAHPRKRALACIGLTLCATLCGCGGGDYDIDAAFVRRRGAAVEHQRLQQSAIRVPDDAPFNVVLPASEQHGTARAEATADEKGTAACRATSDGRGNGEARFQLGHRIDLGPGADTPAVIRMDIQGRRQHSHAGADPETSAQAQLWIFVKDTHGAVLRKESLIPADAGDWARGDFRVRPQFDLALAADTGYFVILAGRSSAAAVDGQRAEASLDITSFSIEISAAPAPASRPAGP